MVPPLLAIFSWPIVGWVLFRKLSLQHALIWCIVGGYLFLPDKVGFNLPVLPTISKSTIPSIVALVIVTVVARQYRTGRAGGLVQTPGGPILEGWIPRHGLMAVLFFGVLIGEVLTVLTNGNRLVYGPLVLPGLSLYDAGSRLMTAALELLPLLLARKYLSAPEQHRTLVVTFVVAGLIYSLPTLWEVRMSPQLNLQIYGMRVGSWVQHVRSDGFRPLVFLRHGLWLAVFIGICCVAAVAYIRLAPPSRKTIAIAAAVWLFATLILMNSLGGLVIATLVMIVAFFSTKRMQMLVAAGFAVAFLAYPMLRGGGLVPLDWALSQAEKIDPDRAQSLRFRFRHEDLLLEKVEQKPVFGWGSWGRNQIYDDDGNNLSVTDGEWIIQIGSNGWFGYLTKFGLLSVPIIILTVRRRRYPTDLATASVALMLTVNQLDLIPNSALNAVTWLLAGALMGRLEHDVPLAKDTTLPDQDHTDHAASIPKGPAYSRQTKLHHRGGEPTEDTRTR